MLSLWVVAAADSGGFSAEDGGEQKMKWLKVVRCSMGFVLVDGEAIGILHGGGGEGFMEEIMKVVRQWGRWKNRFKRRLGFLKWSEGFVREMWAGSSCWEIKESPFIIFIFCRFLERDLGNMSGVSEERDVGLVTEWGEWIVRVCWEWRGMRYVCEFFLFLVDWRIQCNIYIFHNYYNKT